MDENSSEQIEKIIAWLGTGSINIFGLPFSGKDTQAQRLSALLHAPVIGGGDIIRNHENVPDHVRETVAKGNLAPQEAYINIVAPYLNQDVFAGRPLILSSLGRWHGEEVAILEAAETSGHPIKTVVYLALDESKVRERWEASQAADDRGQREDDAEHILDVRLDEFRNKTMPVIGYYREQDLLIEVDGNASQEDVTAEILDKLAQKARG